MASYTDLAAIAQQVVLERYGDTQAFSLKILQGNAELFTDWQKGDAELSKRQLQQIRQLFTDYEWMLVQKAIFQAQTIPELEGKSAFVYQNAKKQIAEYWVKATNCQTIFKKEAVLKQPVMHLRLTLDYKLWGFEDVLDFIVPEHVHQAIATKQLDLLTWANNLQITA